MANRQHFCIFIFLLLFIPTGYSTTDNQEKNIYLVFRFDDYSAKSNTELELKIIETFQKNNLAFTIGVIPFEGAGNLLDPSPQGNLPLGVEKANILKNASNQGVIEIGLHGYSHQSHSSQYRKSEFRGLEYINQKDKILKGKKYLEEITDTKINTFIPPWNQYDSNTLKVLDELQFKNISADKYGIMKYSTKIEILPNSCSLLKIKEAVANARESSDKESIIVALFHAYDFIEDDKKRGILNYTEFVDLINWVSQQPDVKVSTIDKLILELPSNYLRAKHRINEKTIAYSLKTPPYIRGASSYTYASKAYFKLLRIKALLFYFSILIVISSIAYILLMQLSFVDTKNLKITIIISIILFSVMIGYSILNPTFGYNIGVVFTILSSFILTTILIAIVGKQTKK